MSEKTNSTIIDLFGLNNRTAVLLDLIERTPLKINEIDIARIAKKYPIVPSRKLSLSNSLTVKRRALDYFVEKGFVYFELVKATGTNYPAHLYHLDMTNPVIQGIIPLIRLEVKKDV